MDWKSAKAILDGEGKRRGPRDSVKIARNTYLERGREFSCYSYHGKGNTDDYPKGTIGLRLHNTYVVIFTPKWIELNTGGWPTKVTAERMEYAGISIEKSGKAGWSVALKREDLPCHCCTSWGEEEVRPGFAHRFTDRWTGEPYDHANGSKPIYEWVQCSTCQGSLKRAGFDHGNGHPFYDGIRIAADLKRLAKTQPHKPESYRPLKTERGWQMAGVSWGGY